jgi:hypothetical protein
MSYSPGILAAALPCLRAIPREYWPQRSTQSLFADALWALEHLLVVKILAIMTFSFHFLSNGQYV